MPIIPLFIMMAGMAVIIAGLLENIWWIWVIGIGIFVYPLIIIKIAMYKYDKEQHKNNRTGKAW